MLMPELCDLVKAGLPGLTWSMPRRLRHFGGGVLDPSKTLSQNGIRDGSTLLFTADPPIVGRRPTVDPAAQLAADCALAGWVWTRALSRTAALLVAVAAAGLTGYLGVPGPPGPARLMLGAAAAATAATIAGRIDSNHPAVFTSVGFGGLLVAACALPAVAFGATGRHLAVLLAVAAVAALLWSVRLTVLRCGLSPRITVRSDRVAQPAPTTTAPHTLSALVVAASCCALGAVIGIVATTPTSVGSALGATVATAVLLAGHTDPIQRAATLSAAGLSAAAVIATAAVRHSTWAPWLVGALLAGVGVLLWLTHTVTAPRISPGPARCADATGLVLLASLPPLACWTAGLYRFTAEAAGR